MWGRMVVMVGMALVASAAWSADRWFNMQITDPTEPVEVSLRVPVPLVSSILEGVHSTRVRSHRVHLDWDLDAVDTEALLAKVRAVADDGETRFVQDGADVLVRRYGALLRLDVTGRSGDAVEIELPVVLLEALDIRDDRLDLRPLVSHLERVTGEVLRVRAGETRVRIWVEER